MDSAHSQHQAGHQAATTPYFSVFAALIALLVVTVAVAEIDLGRFNFPIAAAIASLKAILILLFFMHVRDSKPLTWLIAGAGFFWLGIMFVLTFGDYATRGDAPDSRPDAENVVNAQQRLAR